MHQEITIPAGEHRKEPTVITVTESTTLSITIGDDAQACIVCAQCAPCAAPLRITQEATLGAGSRVHWFNVTLGPDVEHTFVARCVGAGARSTVDWIAYAAREDRQRLSACNLFSAPHGGGEITIKGVAQDCAKMRSEGSLVIEGGGSGTSTYLTEHILMLDPKAQVDAIPALDIKTNDVKASHSATVSRVSPEDLFYFGARGISEADARRMYILGFLGGLLQHIALPKLRQDIFDAIASKYGSIHPIAE